jgi:hypothetical protein
MSSVHGISNAPGGFTRIKPQPQRDHEEGCRKNIEGIERVVSLVVGFVMICGIFQQSWMGALTAMVGAWLVYRGATGHCPVCSLIATTSEEDDFEATDESVEQAEHDILKSEAFSTPVRRRETKPRGRRGEDWSELEAMPRERESSFTGGADSAPSRRNRRGRDFEG